ISFLPISLIAFEFITEKSVSNKYMIYSLDFNEEGEVGEYEENDIEAVYQIKDSPPYERIDNIFVTHKFTKFNGEIVPTKTYRDFISEMNNSENTLYEQTYHFFSNKIVIRENLHKVEEVSFTINDRIVNRQPISVNETFLLNLRYRDIGLVMKEDILSDLEELIV